MGLCGSSLTQEEKRALEASRNLDRDCASAYAKETEKIKLLLLGAGESGKSTIFKQMKQIHGSGFSDDEAKAMIPVIFNNTIISIKILIQAAEDPEIAKKGIVAQDAKQFMMNLSDDAVITEDIARSIQTLWADPGIQDAYGKRSKFQLMDSAQYYFERLDTISSPDYLPDLQDILRSRVRTSGIVEERYKIDGVDFCMYDVGGQRNERKKWIHCFDDVTAVIFVAAMSEYDQVLYEDNKQNRMTEAINLFDEICNSRWFQETSMILFLNKVDLFEEKIKKVDIGATFDPEYTYGVCTCGHGYPTDSKPCECGIQDIAKDFILKQFLDVKKEEELRGGDDPKEIYSHITCATNTDNVRVVFAACKDIILKNNLKGSGFMD